MIEALFNQPNYLATKKMLDASVLRQEAIASNLANLETPNYKRVDVAPSFTDSMKSAVKSQNLGQISGLTPSIGLDPTALAANRDGNTVELESELLHLNQNALAHTLETQLISGNLLKLRLAITGRNS